MFSCTFLSVYHPPFIREPPFTNAISCSTRHESYPTNPRSFGLFQTVGRCFFSASRSIPHFSAISLLGRLRFLISLASRCCRICILEVSICLAYQCFSLASLSCLCSFLGPRNNPCSFLIARFDLCFSLNCSFVKAISQQLI